MKKLTALLCFWFLLTGAVSFASGIQVDALISGLRNPLTDSFLDSGLVYTYSAGTTASKSLYMDAAMTTASTNPVVLNAYGQALRFAKGKYKFVIKTSGGTTLWTLDNLEYDSVATLASKTANPFGPTMSVTNFSTPNLTATAAANFSMNGYKITNLATPTSAYDAATYQYVASEVAYLASTTSSATSNISSTTSYSLSVLDTKIASITPVAPNSYLLATTTSGYDTDSLLVGSGSWVNVAGGSFTNGTPDNIFYRLDMSGSLGLLIATTSAVPLVSGNVGIIDNDGLIYDQLLVSQSSDYSLVATPPTGLVPITTVTPFTLTAYVMIAPGVTKTFYLAYKDIQGTSAGMYRATNGRWFKSFKVK